MPKIKKNCAYCGKAFEVWPSTQERRKNCSRECNYEWQRIAQAGENNGNYRHGQAVGISRPKQRGRYTPAPPRPKREPYKGMCLTCDTPFESHDKRKKYCDRKCYKDDHKIQWITDKCEHCGKETTYNATRPKKFCSRSCMTKQMHLNHGNLVGTVNMICPNCWTFYSISKGQKDRAANEFCSRKYSQEFRQEIVQCAWCHSEIVKPKSRADAYDRSFCSDEHRLTWLNGGFFEPSKPEILAKEILDQLGITYEFQHPFGKYVFDFAILDHDQKIDLEIDGEYHHSLPQNAKRDRRRDWWARKNGWKVIRIPSKKISSDFIAKKLAKAGFNLEKYLH
jgi:very-short-patch-repair endonuclease